GAHLVDPRGIDDLDQVGAVQADDDVVAAVAVEVAASDGDPADGCAEGDEAGQKRCVGAQDEPGRVERLDVGGGARCGPGDDVVPAVAVEVARPDRGAGAGARVGQEAGQERGVGA